jgi:leucyl aminopeptidase (aminopeptidase T)
VVLIDNLQEKIMNGCRQAVVVCLNVSKEDSVVIITDESCKRYADGMAVFLENIGCNHRTFYMEEFGTRPLPRFPSKIADAMTDASASIFIAGSYPGELQNFRRPMLEIVQRNRIRHAHMIGVTDEIMSQGMNADYNMIRDFAGKLYEILTKAKTIRVTTPAGTDITAEFSPKIRWINMDGFITRDSWNNLPEGEIFTCVSTITGRYVVDGVLGDYFSKKYGLLDDNPVDIALKDGRIQSIECTNKQFEAELEEYIKMDENASRIGEFALGTNLGLKKLIGNLLQDEKFPGVHMAIGHGYPSRTGSGWMSKAHLDMVIRKPTVVVDGRTIMVDGEYRI